MLECSNNITNTLEYPVKSIFFQELSDGLSIFIEGKQTFVPKTHANFDSILKSLREKAFAKIEDLINGVTAAKPVLSANWPFPGAAVQRSPSRISVPAPQRKNYHKNRRVYVFDNGSYRGVVYLKNANKLYDRTGVFIATVGSPNVKIRAARTATVEKMLLRIPKGEREKFYIVEEKAVPVLQATVDADTDGVIARVKNIVAEQLGITDVDFIQPKHHFILDLGADSLDLIELVMGFEDEFGGEVTDAEAEKLTTVQEVVDYVRSRLSH
jgi:acyl carrier protein